MARQGFKPQHGTTETKPEAEVTKPEATVKPELIKIKTSKPNRFNSIVNFAFGAIRFDINGEALVTQLQAEELITDQSITILGNDFSPINKISSLADAQKVVDSKEREAQAMLKVIEKQKSEIAALKSNVESKDKIIADFRQKEKDAEITEAKRKLQNFTPAQLREKCENLELPKGQWEKLGKDELIEYLYNLLRD